MAISINQISSVVNTKVMPFFTDNVYKSSAFLARLKKNSKKWDGGNYYEVPIAYAKNSNAMWYTGAGQLTIAQVEELTKARFSPKQMNTAITLTGLEMEENKGPEKILDLVKTKIQLAEQAAIDLMSTALFGSGAGNSIEGLGLVEAATGTSYGGILDTDVAAGTWLCNGGSGPDTTTTALTRNALDALFNKCKIDQDKPTLIVTTDDIYAGIAATFLEPQMRYQDAKLAEMGFESFRYRGADVITDSHCGSGDLHMINEKHLWLAPFSGMDFKFIPWQDIRDYDTYTAHVRWYGNLICDNRYKQGVMTAISTFSGSTNTGA